ncbi:MAG TPA: hypothetical protein DDZ81_20670 [Acetobacteraceae bacterium]|nr:hypothetical protein [Acetobacteraceae bacterium]
MTLALTLTASSAWAQDTDSLRTGLSEMLSVLTLGAVSVPASSPRVTQTGNDFHIQVPLSGFSAPPGAVAEAVARPEANGAWTIAALSFPTEGAIGPGIDQSVSYTIGQQTIRGRLDPTLATTSNLSADLGTITLQSVAGGRDNQQTLERLTLDGNLSAAPGGRVDLLGRASAANWHAMASDPAAYTSVRHLDGHFALTGLDQAQAARLLVAARSLSSMPKARAQHEGPRALLEAANGLLTHIDVDQTVDGVKFDLGHGSAGALGRMKVHLKGGAEDHLVNATADIAADEASWASVSSDMAGFMPHHVTARSVLAGLPVGPLMALLRAAAAPNADQAALQRQAAALLNTPGARAAIESLNFDAGPVHVRGSAKFLPRPNGDAGADIHISASGVDALMAQVQGNATLRGIIPFLFIAQGLARPGGDGLSWDIAIGGGPLTINGTAFGQPLGKTR